MAVAQEPIKFYGVKETIALMRQVQPEMLKQLRKDIRKIANPAVTAIKSTVPSVSPFAGRSKDGMSHNGKTAWSGVAVSVSVTPGQRSRGFASTTANLAAIVSTGKNKQFGFNIVDMAGKSNKVRSGGRTRPYQRNGVTRTHALNGQGAGLISNLPKRPSRYVYPAIESKLPAIYSEVASAIEVASQTINGKIRRI
jgi:hypothetical protein